MIHCKNYFRFLVLHERFHLNLIFTIHFIRVISIHCIVISIAILTSYLLNVRSVLGNLGLRSWQYKNDRGEIYPSTARAGDSSKWVMVLGPNLFILNVPAFVMRNTRLLTVSVKTDRMAQSRPSKNVWIYVRVYFIIKINAHMGN